MPPRRLSLQHRPHPCRVSITLASLSLILRKASSGARPLETKNRLYFFGTTASLQAFATRNFTTIFAGILIVAPV